MSQENKRHSYDTMGDSGDIVHFAASIKASGGGTLYCRKPYVPRIPLIRQLLLAQDYIDDVLPFNGQHIEFKASDFRNGPIPYGLTLAEIHARWVGVSPDFSLPWLQVEPSPKTKGRIVVSRTARYQNKFFPWEKLVQTFGPEMLFVGLPAEHKEFCRLFGTIAHLPTNDLYDVARAIAGSEVFFGNQSSPNAICEGLKHRLVQETCLDVPDCIFARDNATHCVDGALDIEVLGRTFRSECSIPKPHLDLQTTPPGGWQLSYDGEFAKSYDLNVGVAQIGIQLRNAGKEVPRDLRDRLISIMRDRQPMQEYAKPVQRARELVRRLYRREPA